MDDAGLSAELERLFEGARGRPCALPPITPASVSGSPIRCVAGESLLHLRVPLSTEVPDSSSIKPIRVI